jgi:hypothetical protein
MTCDPGSMRRARNRHSRSLLLAAAALALEIALILPFVDDLADENSTVHFTQHGLIFAGGVVMGYALHGAWRTRR